MTVCEKVGAHAGQARQFDLPHFIFTVIRCARCDQFLQTKVAAKEAKNEKSIE